MELNGILTLMERCVHTETPPMRVMERSHHSYSLATTVAPQQRLHCYLQVTQSLDVWMFKTTEKS